MFDKLHEACGVFGIFGHSEAAKLTYLGLYSLQHRGQESAGIAASDGDRSGAPPGEPRSGPGSRMRTSPISTEAPQPARLRARIEDAIVATTRSRRP